MQKTQLQMYWDSHNTISDMDKTFNDLITHPTHPLTKNELERLIEKRPSIWQRYSSFLKTLK